MSRTFSILLTMLAVLVSTTGCDFFRRMAGRPVSEEIRIKAEVIAADSTAREKARMDSIGRVWKHSADSLAAMDSLKQEKVMSPRNLGGLKEGSVLKKYYIVVGSFSAKSNAERLCNEVAGKGYSVETIPFRNGFTAVGLCGTDDVVEIRRSLNEVRRQDFCPKGVWILVNEKYEE